MDNKDLVSKAWRFYGECKRMSEGAGCSYTHQPSEKGAGKNQNYNYQKNTQGGEQKKRYNKESSWKNDGTYEKPNKGLKLISGGKKLEPEPVIESPLIKEFAPWGIGEEEGKMTSITLEIPINVLTIISKY